jgi:hypothetical protein
MPSLFNFFGPNDALFNTGFVPFMPSLFNFFGPDDAFLEEKIENKKTQVSKE